ncbi:hypothetical protein DFQ27_001369 [Actinomortierella ambigua]|uniref:Uncharacterized protein n=1 Tax=Actinomortierella ambigua TaxID=1343610 RepID=A0A9P6QAD4_9FUNG|nr:hypothetical protein DFQ27_001369 [Actinomortierella ambigua]
MSTGGKLGIGFGIFLFVFFIILACAVARRSARRSARRRRHQSLNTAVLVAPVPGTSCDHPPPYSKAIPMEYHHHHHSHSHSHSHDPIGSSTIGRSATVATIAGAAVIGGAAVAASDNTHVDLTQVTDNEAGAAIGSMTEVVEGGANVVLQTTHNADVSTAIAYAGASNDVGRDGFAVG